jgi:ABC-type transport system involved in multi-copper enzyme maturation permease subunit
MGPLIRAELLKVRTARGMLITAAAAVGLSLLLMAVYAGYETFNTADEQETLLGNASFGQIVVLVLGAIVVAGEYRHKTVTGTFLVTPERWRVILAKILVAMLVAALAGLVAVVLGIIVTFPWVSARGEELPLGAGEVAAIVGRIVLGYALFAALGAGIGAILRRQAAAAITAIVLILVLDPALSAASEEISRFGINGASAALAGVDDGTDALSPALGGLVLAGWAALAAVAGTLLVERRDT